MESTSRRGKASSFSQCVNAYQPANACNSQHWLTPSPHTVHASEPILLAFYNMPFAKCLFFHIKTVRQAESKPAICRIWLQRRSGMKWFLLEESPSFPCSKPQPKTREPFRWTPSFWTAVMLVARYSNQLQVCMCTHTKVFSKPAVDVYCFPSPQLAVKHLIQQLWPSANSALRTLSATSLGQDTRKTQQGI